MKRLVLIDGNALVHRAFHALPPLTAPNGMITNAVFGFSSILLRMIKDIQPDYIMAAFDLAGPTVRHSDFEDYKAHRPKAPQELYDQIGLVKDLLRDFGVPVYEKPSYEADDLIGTLATKAKQIPDLQVIIATGDMDTLQLVDDDKVQVFTLKKGVNDTVVYDQAAVEARYGLHPHQLNDFKGLKGDPSDNIPGVPGIGEKTAAALIQEFGTLENLYTELEQTDSTHKLSAKLKEKLLTNKNLAFLSKQLSTIFTDLDIEFVIEQGEWRQTMKLEAVKKAFRDYGFNRLLTRLDEIVTPAKPITSDQQTLFDVATPETSPESHQLRTKDIPTLSQEAHGTGQLFLSARFDNDQLIELLVSPDDVMNYHTQQFDMLKAILEGSSIAKIGHDLKPIAKILLTHDIRLTNLGFDTAIAAYLLNPELRNYDFDKIYYQEFNTVPTQADPPSPADIRQLAQHLEAKLRELQLFDLFRDIEMPLIMVLAQMERYGITIDLDQLKQLLISTQKEIAKLEQQIYQLAGREFNINSPAQMRVVLFDELGINPAQGRIKKTGAGERSTAAEELEKLRNAHPIINLILHYREIQKLKTTYIEPFPSLTDPVSHRIHTTYLQTGTATGRLSSQDPNLQNIPTRTALGQEFRKAFIAEAGYQLAAFDYSQLELRIAAHLAEDPIMIEAFREGEDIHTRTAAEIFGVASEAVTKDQRRQAKVLNFGILYGMGPLAFARNAGVDRAQAQAFIERYFSEFKGIAHYLESVKNQARQDGYTTTLFGRRRSAIDLHSSMPQVRAQAERIAINHPIQGTEADLIKMAMIKIDKHIRERYPHGQVRMLLQVHDELVFEIKDSLITTVVPEIRQIMESVYQLSVPLTVDAKIGPNWTDMTVVSYKE